MLVPLSCWRCAIFQLQLYLCGHRVRDPNRVMSVHSGWGSLLVALGSHSLVGEQNSLSCWTAALPGQDSDHLAHRVTSNSVKPGLDYCASPPKSLLTFTIIQCFFSTFFQGEGQTPCHTTSRIPFTLDISAHFPVLTAAKTGPRCQERAVGGRSLPHLHIFTGCSSFCFSASGSSLDMLNPLIWQKLYCRSSGTCHLTVLCHRQGMRVEMGRWDFNLV